VDSCSFTNGFTQIGSASCVGTTACARLTNGTIFEGSCVGVGSCSKSGAYNSMTASFTVGSHACLGCYSCVNSTAGTSTNVEYADLVS
jgi:hypothetical protein